MSTYQNILGIMYAYDAEVPQQKELLDEVLEKGTGGADALHKWEFFNKYSEGSKSYKDLSTKRDYVYTELLESADAESFVFFHLWMKLNLTKIKLAMSTHSSFEMFLDDVSHNAVVAHTFLDVVESRWDELQSVSGKEREEMIDGMVFESYKRFLKTVDESEASFIQAYLYEVSDDAVNRSAEDERYEKFLSENENLTLKTVTEYVSGARFSEEPAAQLLVFIEKLDAVCTTASILSNLTKQEAQEVMKEEK